MSHMRRHILFSVSSQAPLPLMRKCGVRQVLEEQGLRGRLQGQEGPHLLRMQQVQFRAKDDADKCARQLSLECDHACKAYKSGEFTRRLINLMIMNPIAMSKFNVSGEENSKMIQDFLRQPN